MATTPLGTKTPLQTALFESGLKQTWLAEKCGVSEAHLSRIVNGLHPADDLADKLSQHLRCGKTVLWPHLYVEPGEELERAA